MRRALVTLCLFSGITCLWGGLELVLAPDGSLVRLPLWVLRHSPFPDFLVPGLLLAGVVGASSTAAGLLALARRPSDNGAAMVAGIVLATWIAVEMALLRGFHWLHGVYLALATAMVTVAAAREARAGKLRATVRSLERAAAHGFVGWALCAGAMGALLARYNLTMALFIHGLAAPAIFLGVSASYFARDDAWPPLPTALAFTALVVLLDLTVVACFVTHSLDIFRSALGTWLPVSLVFVITWATGLASSGEGVLRPWRGRS